MYGVAASSSYVVGMPTTGQKSTNTSSAEAAAAALETAYQLRLVKEAA